MVVGLAWLRELPPRGRIGNSATSRRQILDLSALLVAIMNWNSQLSCVIGTGSLANRLPPAESDVKS